MKLRMKNKITGHVFTGEEFNKHTEEQFIHEVTTLLGGVQVERFGNIFKFQHGHNPYAIETYTLVYGDMLMYDTWGEPVVVVPEAHVWNDFEDVTKQEALDVAHQVFTSEGVDAIMDTPQPMWGGKTGTEYAREHGWYKVWTRMIGFYEGGLV